MTMIKCCTCATEIKRSDKTVVNCLMCELKFHAKCANLNEDLLKIIYENKQIKYVCNHCNNTTLLHEIKDLRDIIKQCMETIIEQKKIIEDHTTIINQLQNKQTHEPNKEDFKKPYSEILKKNNKEMILIKPIKEDQRSDVTQEELKKKINPSELGAAVENVKNIKNGGVIISCKNADSKEKIQKKVEEELGNRYKVESPHLKKPKIIIIGVENNFANQEDHKIVEAITDQNDFDVTDENVFDKIKVVKKYENKKKRNCSNIIVEVETDIFRSIYNRNVLNVGWRECKVEEYHNIIRCYKCARYNHLGRDCQNNVTCLKCSGNHIQTECENEYEKCINCVKTMEKLKIKLDSNHRADHKNCPCYLKMIERDCNRINYNA